MNVLLLFAMLQVAPDSIVTETRTSVPIPQAVEALTPVIEVDVHTDSIVMVMREMMADRAVRDAFQTCTECAGSWAPGWFLGGVLLIGAGYVVSRFFEEVTTITINNVNTQSQEQGTTITTTTTRRGWPGKKKDDGDDDDDG